MVYVSFICLSSPAVNSDILFQPETVVNLLPGEIEFAEISIRAALDGLYEEDQETFTARIVSVTSGSIDPGRQEATVTIIDTDRMHWELWR